MPAAITSSHPKKQHRDDRGGNSAHNGENPKEQQADAEGQEPAPIVDDLRRNPDVQRRDFRHGVLPPSRLATSAGLSAEPESFSLR
jgi:hypothetical protein